MKQESTGGRSVELTTATERGWWLRARRPDDEVRIVFRPDSQTSGLTALDDEGVCGPYRAALVNHEGRNAVVQIFLDGVVGGFLVDIDTADGESRVLAHRPKEVSQALNTDRPGYFAVSAVQRFVDDD